jgi:DNA-binding NarL/FixJ family response regulator
MRCHWEKLGVLGPIRRLASEGLSGHVIADRLNLSEETVRGCVSWLLHFLKYNTRTELILDASPAQSEKWALSAA